MPRNSLILCHASEAYDVGSADCFMSLRSFGKLLQNSSKIISILVNRTNSSEFHTLMPKSRLSRNDFSSRESHLRNSEMKLKQIDWNQMNFQMENAQKNHQFPYSSLSLFVICGVLHVCFGFDTIPFDRQHVSMSTDGGEILRLCHITCIDKLNGCQT